MTSPNRRIIAHIATSADGYIARADGSVDWLNRPDPPGHYGMVAFMRSIDTILWGRKTYDQSLTMGGLGMFGANIAHFVFTHQKPEVPVPDVEFVDEEVGGFGSRLRAAPGKDIWMMGGAGLIGSFLDAGQLDEFRIHVIPVFIGAGIPLIQPRHRNVPLELVSTKRYADGVVGLNYRVLPL